MPALALPGVSLNPSSSLPRGIFVPARWVFLAILAGLSSVWDKLLADPDTHWHIAVGRWIWETRSLPWVDPFSHTFAGAPWIAKEWLSQVIFFATYAAAGWWGLVALSAVVIAASFAGLLWWLQRRVHPTLALALTLVAVILSAGHWLVRPHILTFPVLMVWTMALVDAVERRSGPPWWLLPVMALWTNLHGSFPIGFALAGILAADAVASAPAGGRLAMVGRWGLFGAGLVAAACATPYGYHAMLVSVTLFGSGESLPYIREWQSFEVDPFSIVVVGATLALILALSLRPVENLFRISLVALFAAMMLKHVRFASLFGIVTPILVAGPLARRFKALAPSAPPVVRPRSGLVAGLLLLVVGAVSLARTPEPSPQTTPAAALQEARARGLKGPVYNHYDFGGFLIAQGVPTFIDGRTDQLFLGGFMDHLYKTVRDRDAGAFGDLMRRYGVTWALIKPGSNEVGLLDAMPGWQRVYEDATAVVYAKDLSGPRPALGP